MKDMKRLVLFGIALMSSLSFAGLKLEDPVVVNLAIHEAFGSIGSARNSEDSVQYIGCSIEADLTHDPMAACFAMDVTGTTVLCTSSSPRIVAAVQGISSLSFLDFLWDSEGNCTYVFLVSVSSDPPRAP